MVKVQLSSIVATDSKFLVWWLVENKWRYRDAIQWLGVTPVLILSDQNDMAFFIPLLYVFQALVSHYVAGSHVILYELLN